MAGFLYYDARADDARLTLAVARTAALDHGAVVANYTEVVSLVTDASGAVTGARVRPAVPARRRHAGTRRRGPSDGTGEFEVRAQVVVNATGVWADDVRALDERTHPHSIRPAKGIHITVPRPSFPPTSPRSSRCPRTGGRSSWCRGDGDDVYLGTTDTDWDGPLDDPACLPEDVDYLLDAANGVITEPLGRHDVTGVWAGLRPLLAPAAGHHVSERTADLSRRHTVRGLGPRPGHGHRRQAHHLPADGRGHRRRGGEAPRAPRARPAHAGAGPSAWPCVGSAGLEQLRGPGRPRRASASTTTPVAALVGRHGGETPAVLALAVGPARAPRAARPGPAPPARRGALGGAPRDGHDRRRRPGPPHPRPCCGGPAAAAEAAPGVAELLGAGLGSRRRRRRRARRPPSPSGPAGDLARAGLGPAVTA